MLSRSPSTREERLECLRGQLDHPLAVDAADPTALQRVADRVEHAEPHQGSVCTTTSAIAGTAVRTRSSIALARPCASASDKPTEAERQEHDDPVVGPDQPQLARLGPGLLPYRLLDRRGVDVDLLAGRRLAKRLEMRLHARHLRDLRVDRCFDLLRDVVCLIERKSPGSFRWSATSMLPSTSRTLRLWISRTYGTVSAAARNPLAERAGAVARLDVDDDVDPREGALQSVLHAVRSGVSLTDRRAGATPMTTSAKCSPPARAIEAAAARRVDRAPRVARRAILASSSATGP